MLQKYLNLFRIPTFPVALLLLVDSLLQWVLGSYWNLQCLVESLRKQVVARLLYVKGHLLRNGRIALDLSSVPSVKAFHLFPHLGSNCKPIYI